MKIKNESSRIKKKKVTVNVKKLNSIRTEVRRMNIKNVKPGSVGIDIFCCRAM